MWMVRYILLYGRTLFFMNQTCELLVNALGGPVCKYRCIFVSGNVIFEIVQTINLLLSSHGFWFLSTNLTPLFLLPIKRKFCHSYFHYKGCILEIMVTLKFLLQMKPAKNVYQLELSSSCFVCWIVFCDFTNIRMSLQTIFKSGVFILKKCLPHFLHATLNKMLFITLKHYM